MIDVVAFGELLIDFIPAGGDSEGPCMKAMVGGAPGNFVAAAQAYGSRCAMIAKVGKDAFGDMLISRLAHCGIEVCGIVQDESVFTTMAFVHLSPEGERSFSFARKPGADTCLREKEVDFSLIEQARLFHFGTLSLTHEPARSATYAGVKCAKENGKLISFDPNLRLSLWLDSEAARAQMLWGLKQADVVKISDDEVKFLFHCGAEAGAAIILEKYPAKLVFVTCGAKGCYFAAENSSGWVDTPKVQTIDATGAGDIFFGAAISQMLQSNLTIGELESDEMRRIVSFACTAASLSTESHGGIGSIVPAQCVLEHLNTMS